MNSNEINYNETIKTWNKLASLYEEKFMFLNYYNESYLYFCNAISKNNAEILEIGCGPGNITKFMIAKRPDFKILGTDVAPAMIELAQKNIPEATFKVLDARNVNSLQQKFHGIICGFCIPYLSEIDCENLIKDCSNMLHSGGVLYLSYVDGDKTKSGFITGSSGDRTYFYYHEYEQLRKLFENSGFGEIIKFEVKYPIADNGTQIHTILVVQKK